MSVIFFVVIPIYIANAVTHDDLYIKIGMLTNEYIDLNQQFIKAVKDDRPASELNLIKESIRTILQEIEQLEAVRAARSNDKDELPTV